jgi:hypothetical protein
MHSLLFVERNQGFDRRGLRNCLSESWRRRRHPPLGWLIGRAAQMSIYKEGISETVCQ